MGRETDSLRNYQIIQELFRSNNGAVFKVRRRGSSGPKNLLCLKERRFAELGRKRDILNEVRLLQMVDHPNVIKCYGHFWEVNTGSLFMILEFIDGGDLYAELVRRRTRKIYLSEEMIWSLFYQICKGVHHLHKLGIIHRDLKTLNIMLSKDLQCAKVADLGVSRQVSEQTLFLKTFYGTPLYASPELCRNKPYTEKTDMWSLGVILYEMAALTQPFNSDSLLGLSEAIKNGRYTPLPDHYSRSLCDLVAALLQTDPERRPSISTVLSYFKPAGKEDLSVLPSREERVQENRKKCISSRQEQSQKRQISPDHTDSSKIDHQDGVLKKANSKRLPQDGSIPEFVNCCPCTSPTLSAWSHAKENSREENSGVDVVINGCNKLTAAQHQRALMQLRRKRLHLRNLHAQAGVTAVSVKEKAVKYPRRQPAFAQPPVHQNGRRVKANNLKYPSPGFVNNSNPLLGQQVKRLQEQIYLLENLVKGSIVLDENVGQSQEGSICKSSVVGIIHDRPIQSDSPKFELRQKKPEITASRAFTKGLVVQGSQARSDFNKYKHQKRLKQQQQNENVFEHDHNSILVTGDPQAGYRNKEKGSNACHPIETREISRKHRLYDIQTGLGKSSHAPSGNRRLHQVQRKQNKGRCWPSECTVNFSKATTIPASKVARDRVDNDNNGQRCKDEQNPGRPCTVGDFVERTALDCAKEQHIFRHQLSHNNRPRTTILPLSSRSKLEKVKVDGASSLYQLKKEKKGGIDDELIRGFPVSSSVSNTDIYARGIDAPTQKEAPNHLSETKTSDVKEAVEGTNCGNVQKCKKGQQDVNEAGLINNRDNLKQTNSQHGKQDSENEHVFPCSKSFARKVGSSAMMQQKFVKIAPGPSKSINSTHNRYNVITGTWSARF